MYKSIVLVLLSWLLPMPSLAHGDGIPTYLFTDDRFWVFLLTNLAGIVLSALIIYLLFSVTAKKPWNITRQLSRTAVVLAVIAVGYQLFHHIEHIAQAYQYFLLELPIEESHGILWFFDVEWNHFIFNAGYFLILSVIAWSLMNVLSKERLLRSPSHLLLLAMLVIPQGIHLAEHVARITRHISLGCDPCPGVIDTAFGFNTVWLHLIFNTVVFTLPLAVFLWYSFGWKLKEYIKQFLFCFGVFQKR